MPGIDFTNDPLLQARNFSYLDTQLLRLAGPNFPQIPINRPIAEVRNDQRDGFHQRLVHESRTSYAPNSISGGCPAAMDGYRHYQEKVEGSKIRMRSPSFEDHYSQATLFWNSMSGWEKQHIVAVYLFELGHVERKHIKEGVVAHLGKIHPDLASQVAQGLGLPEPAMAEVHSKASPALSMTGQPRGVATRKIAILMGDGADHAPISLLRQELEGQGAICEVVAPVGGTVGGLPVARQLSAANSVLYDAVVAADGAALEANGRALFFVKEAFKHGKAIAAVGSGRRLVEAAQLPNLVGVVMGDGNDIAKEFAEAVAGHRFYERDVVAVPA